MKRVIVAPSTLAVMLGIAKVAEYDAGWFKLGYSDQKRGGAPLPRMNAAEKAAYDAGWRLSESGGALCTA